MVVRDVDGLLLDTELLSEDNEQLVILDFWAPWCKPCKDVEAWMSECARDHDIVLGKINVQTQTQLAVRFNVNGLPTLIAYHRGAELGRMVGASSKAALAAWLERMALLCH